MPLQDYMKIVSVDDHLLEPQDLWTKRLPAKYQESGPRVVPDGRGDPWVYEGRKYYMEATLAIAGTPAAEYRIDPVRFAEMRPGCYDPVERLLDMDADGVYAEVSFPTFPRFSGTRFLEGQDKELAKLCVRAWNEFVFDEWCAADRDRLIPMVILPLWDIELAAAEAQWAAERGARAVSFPENTASLGLPSIYGDYWDPVFSVLNEASIPLCTHFGSSGVIPNTCAESPGVVRISLYPTNLMATTADFIFSPTFQKFPNLKVALSEGGIGWIPFMLEKMDITWSRHRHYQPQLHQDTPPSVLFAQHIYGCFIDDEHGIKNASAIGIEHIMFESDYPHSDCNWPNSRKLLSRMVAGLSDEDAHRVAELNARKLFNFPLKKEGVRAGV